MFCTKCGKELNSGDRFCAHCGAETKQNEPRRNKYEDVVFNPPFRIEAERKTAEIIKAREDLKGNSMPENEVPAETKGRERLNLNWDLDGLPRNEQKKTEEINFDWGEFVEKRKSESREPIGSFEFGQTLQEKKAEPIGAYADKRIAPDKEEKAERILDSLFGAGAGREFLKEELPKPVAEPVVEHINIDENADESESIISLEDLENELFGEGEKKQFNSTSTVQYRPINISEVDSSEELDSFFGEENNDNIRLDGREFDPSATAVFTPVENKLQNLFKEESHDSINNDSSFSDTDFAETLVSENADVESVLFEDILNDISDIDAVEEPTTEAKPIVMSREKTAVEVFDEPLLGEELLDETIADTLSGEAAEGEKISESADGKESVNLYDELFSEPELSPEERENQKFYTFNRNTDAFKELLRRERERLEEMGADYVPQNLTNEKSAKKQAPKLKPVYVSTALPAATTNVDATGIEPVIISGPGYTKEIPEAKNEFFASAAASDDSDSVKYADIFSGTEPRTTVTSAGISISEEKLSQKTEKAQQLKEFFDEIDKEVPKKGSIFGKIILAIFIIALLTCGTAAGAKYFFPDSIVAEYSDIAIKKGLALIEKVRGNDENVVSEVEDIPFDTEAESRSAYITGIILTEAQGLKNVGEVYYSADENLRFAELTTPAFEEVASTPELEITEGVSNYDAAPVISAVLSYYDSWHKNNSDSEFPGVNKLEICDIRTNGETAYILCRVFFATESGEETIRVETVRTVTGETETAVETVMEEKIQ